jgi:hypothetical protein
MTAQLSAPAIGYRAFKWDGTGPLKSTGVKAEWPISRAPQYATCIQTTTPRHVAPQEDCACGIHAYSAPSQVGAGVGGVVMGYGNLIIHPDGWRAEIVELDLLAEQYGVRVLDRWEDAAAVAREYGAEPVPGILHAEAEAWHLGPEKHEPLFPGMGALCGDLEARVRELAPWLERHMLRRTEIQFVPTHSSPYYLSNPLPSVSLSVNREMSLYAVHPSGAQVEITLLI